VRTRVGYAGGTLREPTYHHLGDHSETIEIDYDPSLLSYEDLVAVFVSSHNPSSPSFSTQYRSAIFYRTDEERAIAGAALARAEAVRGKLHTAIEPFSAFWRAEDYHQKYRLRSHRELMAEFRAMYPADRDFVDSTTAARVNGWLDGYAESEQVDRELPLTGLSQHAQDEVRGHALPRARALQR
jgi:peptide-methionine (S)-S-oxide reductase